MKKQETVNRVPLDQRGFTLAEVMVSTALVGVIFLAMLGMFGQVGTFAGSFFGQSRTIEGVSEAVGILNAVIPQATRIKTCNCRGVADTRADCIWSADDPWRDPVRDDGAASPLVILSGEYEAYDGTQTLTSMAGLNMPATFRGATCIAQESTLPTTLQRGCRQAFSLRYTASTAATASESLAGALSLIVTPVSPPAGWQPTTIGKAHVDGADGLGVTELSCGFDSSSGAVTGANFVLNFRVKSKRNRVRNTAHANYESWYRGRALADQSVLATKNYMQGQFRDVALKFAMKNISTRGIYSWRGQSIRNCVRNGLAPTPATAFAQCCSQAVTAGICVPCVRAGVAGTVNNCCSGKVAAGLCL